jgi:hypothetical protein
MSTTIQATFDGQVFRPTEPVFLEPDTPVRLTIDAAFSNAEAVPDYPEADFYEPVVHNWSDSLYVVDDALRTYYGQTNADR